MCAAGELPTVWQQAACSRADKGQLLLKLLQLAISWQVRSLMLLLQRRLSEALTVDTAPYALILADQGKLQVRPSLRAARCGRTLLSCMLAAVVVAMLWPSIEAH